jgi:tRNA threonylcarbamoyladenosine biosynthesis protein TsaB
MVDARRMEVFTKMLDNNLNEVIKNQAMILDENSFSKFLNDKIYFFGSGAKKYTDLINIQNFKYVEDIRPESKYMGNLSYNKFLKKDFQDVISFEPYYIKDFHLIKKKDKWVRS